MKNCTLYSIPPARLSLARHTAANALMRAAVRGHRRTANQYARIVASCDEALGVQQRTGDGWKTLVHDLMAGAR